jgi:hypothetical protein
MAAKISGITTPDSVNTRIGALTFERGFPPEDTKRKVFDEIDYQRAVQAYPMFRFYTPKEGLFDGTWKLPDVELTN